MSHVAQNLPPKPPSLTSHRWLRVIATFVAVWLAIGAIGVVLQALGVPIPDRAVSLIGLTVALGAAFLTRRRGRRNG